MSCERAYVLRPASVNGALELERSALLALLQIAPVARDDAQVALTYLVVLRELLGPALRLGAVLRFADAVARTDRRDVFGVLGDLGGDRREDVDGEALGRRRRVRRGVLRDSRLPVRRGTAWVSALGLRRASRAEEQARCRASSWRRDRAFAARCSRRASLAAAQVRCRASSWRRDPAFVARCRRRASLAAAQARCRASSWRRGRASSGPRVIGIGRRRRGGVRVGGPERHGRTWDRVERDRQGCGASRGTRRALSARRAEGTLATGKIAVACREDAASPSDGGERPARSWLCEPRGSLDRGWLGGVELGELCSQGARRRRSLPRCCSSSGAAAATSRPRRARARGASPRRGAWRRTVRGSAFALRGSASPEPSSMRGFQYSRRPSSVRG
jgi:hypothetical protein